MTNCIRASGIWCTESVTPEEYSVSYDKAWIARLYQFPSSSKFFTLLIVRKEKFFARLKSLLSVSSSGAAIQTVFLMIPLFLLSHFASGGAWSGSWSDRIRLPWWGSHTRHCSSDGISSLSWPSRATIRFSNGWCSQSSQLDHPSAAGSWWSNCSVFVSMMLEWTDALIPCSRNATRASLMWLTSQGCGINVVLTFTVEARCRRSRSFEKPLLFSLQFQVSVHVKLMKLLWASW